MTDECRYEWAIFHYNKGKAQANFDFPDPSEIHGLERRKRFVLSTIDGVDDFDTSCMAIASLSDFIAFEKLEFQERYMRIKK